jgi:N-acetyl-D-muramate 6-phosphate phosphatase
MSTSGFAGQRLLDQTQAVLFDLDGTLLDTARDLVNALEIVCAAQGQQAPDPQLASRYVSHGAIGLVRLAFPQLDSAELEPLRAQLVQSYQQNICVHTVAYPGMLDVLEELDKSGIAWGVVTNKLRFLAEPILTKLGLHHRCATLVGGDTAAYNKPHPAPIEFALRELGVQPADAVYVGDAEKDVLAGKAAGTRTIAVTWGYIVPGENPADWSADYTIDQPQELLTL